jgi:hypothetical protein
MRRRIVAFLVGITGLTACSKDANAPAVAALAMAPRVDADMSTGMRVSVAAAPAPAPSPQRTSARKVIRNTTLSLEVRDAEAAVLLVDSLTRRFNLVVADARITRRENRRQAAHYVLHVPAPEFDATLVSLRALGEVQSENGAAEDITKEYTDLETRIAVKESTVQRLQALLATHTAKLSEVLEVEQEISRAVTELERMKGERRFYDTQIAMATITVDIFEPVVVGPLHATPSMTVALRQSLALMGTSAAKAAYFVAFVAPWALLAILLLWGAHLLGLRWPIGHRRPILPS